MKRIFTDQIGRSINIEFPPKRIVSLVPSQTELLSDLGLESQVVGITKFCIRPDHWRKQKTMVGGTKDFNVSKIINLHPDLIIANKEENEPDKIQALGDKCPVWTSDVRNLDMALDMIRRIGEITDRETEANQVTEKISRISGISSEPAARNRVAYLIWFNPFMTIGKDTFIHDMLCRSGYVNVFAEHDSSRYPIVSNDDIIESQPEFVFLSSEPFPFGMKHVKLLQTLLPDSKIMLVDGEMFSWYGSRLIAFDRNRYRFST